MNKVIALDIGNTLIYPKSNNWYITAPIKEMISLHNCSDERIKNALFVARNRVKDYIVAEDTATEIKIYSKFYETFFSTLKIKISREDINFFLNIRRWQNNYIS